MSRAGPAARTAAGGFKISTGSESVIGDRYYIAENRTYVGYDAGLQVGPYQFSFALTDPDKVEHFAFEDGLLVWVVDESYTDNNNSQHTGRGLALPVDARPVPFVRRRHPAEQSAPAVRRDLRSPGRAGRAELRSRDAVELAAVPGPAQAVLGRDQAVTGPRVLLRVADGGPARQHRPLPRQRRERLLDHRQPAELGEDRRIGVSLRVISQNTGGNLIVDIDNAPAP